MSDNKSGKNDGGKNGKENPAEKILEIIDQYYGDLNKRSEEGVSGD